MMINRRSFFIIYVILVLISLTGILLPLDGALAQEISPSGPTDDEVNAIAKQLYCPVCENIPLDVCPTQACTQWRELIREKLTEGWKEDEIKNYFVAQYGDRVLAAPPARGLNWLVYIIPPLAIVGGGYILYRALKAWKQVPPVSEEESQSFAEQDDEYAARIEEELRRR
jgi:cytochrome c-type biogenesis protein CcmH